MIDESAKQIEALILQVHRRNGGQLTQLDWQLKLLDPVLMLDSLDLAEIMVAVERQFRVSPFEAAQPPRTWGDLLHAVTQTRSKQPASQT